jgi:6-phosphogluconate dehydrogenase
MPEQVDTANIGVVGRAVMGSNLARNLASCEGNTVAVYNRAYARTEELITEHPEAGFVPSERIEDFVHSRSRRAVASEAGSFSELRNP